MIRFIDLRGQGTLHRFAFWNTVNDEFYYIGQYDHGNRAWNTWDEFIEDYAREFCQGSLDAAGWRIEPFRNLCPPWVFEEPTSDEEEADIDGPCRLELLEGALRRFLDLHTPLMPAVRRHYQEDERGWNLMLHNALVEADGLVPRPKPELCDKCSGLGLVRCPCGGDGEDCECVEGEMLCDACGGEGEKTCDDKEE